MSRTVFWAEVGRSFCFCVDCEISIWKYTVGCAADDADA
jgi:hypothetical protein